MEAISSIRRDHRVSEKNSQSKGNVAGRSPKKFASIVRFNTVQDDLKKIRSLKEICCEN